MDGRRLSLVLPAFNEQDGLRQAIAEADEALGRLCADYEILVVDDGSRDDTAAIADDEAKRRPKVRALRHPQNRGYGAALRTGFESARFDLVAFTDADCQFDLDDLAGLMARTDEADVAVGYRVHRQDVWRRCFLSRGYNLLARTLLGTTVRDIDCAMKVYRREALARVLPEATGFFVNTEMLTRAAQEGLRVVEVGVRHRPRLSGRSSVSLREVPRTLSHLLPFWWSRVVFSSQSPPAGPTPAGWLGLGVVLLVAALLFFSRLRAPLLEPQEVRYAEIPRQMLAEHSWLVPRLHGQDYLDKPPLFYWSVMASYRIFGVRDWSARLVAGLSGALTVLLTYLWGRRALGERAGLYGSLVLCLMPGFVYRARMLTFDTLLALWVVAALAAAHVAMTGGRLRWGWWLLSALATGLGLLTKGPVALVLLAPIFLVALLDPRLARPGRRAWLGFAAVALGVSAPWYVAVVARDPEFAASFFWRHNVVRFLSPFDHAKPAWYYLPGLFLGLLPWWLLLPGLIGLLRDRTAGARRPAALGFALASFAWMLVFFSASGCKRPSYLLPAFPPLALAIGWYLHSGTPVDLWWRASRPAFASAGLALGASLVVSAAAVVVGLVPVQVGLVLAAVAVGGFAALVALQQRIAWGHAAGVVLVALVVGVQVLLPAYNGLFSPRSQLRRLAGTAERRGQEVVCFPQRYESASFYLPAGRVRTYGPDQRDELLAHLRRHPGTLLMVKSGPVLERLLAELPPGVEFRPGRRQAAIQVGRVVPRGEPLETMLAFDDE